AWVKPVDGNASTVKEIRKLRKRLPRKLVDLIHEFARDPRFQEDASNEPGCIEEVNGDGSFTITEISQPSVPGEAQAGGSCYPVVARYKNGLRRTINLAWGSSIYVCSTGQAFEDVDTAMRCQNDYVKGVPLHELERRYPRELIPV
ncbi:unnamed protein product, partial [Symbiodinium pilosum]